MPALPVTAVAIVLSLSVTMSVAAGTPRRASASPSSHTVTRPAELHDGTSAPRPPESLPGTGAASSERGIRPSARFVWPLGSHRVVRSFAPPAMRWGRGHRGVDLAASVGADVLAPADGIVTFSGELAGRGVLSIRHPEGFSTTYEPVSDRVPTGAMVHRGQRIARLDAGHCAEGACLHWGYRVSRDEYRNPLLLVRMGRPVLIPPVPEG